MRQLPGNSCRLTKIPEALEELQKHRAEELEEQKEAAIVEEDLSKAADYQEEQAEVRKKFEHAEKASAEKRPEKMLQKSEKSDIADVVSALDQDSGAAAGRKGSQSVCCSWSHTLHQRVVGQDEAVQRCGKGHPPWPSRLERSQASNRFFLISGSDRCWKNGAFQGTG